MKQYIEFDIHEEIDFSDSIITNYNEDSRGSDSVTNTSNNTATTVVEEKAKYTRKTIYINREYADVLEFFNRKDSSVAICKLIREALKREKGEVTEVEMSEMMRMIKEIHSLTIK